MFSLTTCSILAFTVWLRASAQNSMECGYHVTGLEGTIKGPFEASVSRRTPLRCQWTITVPSDYKMTLQFQTLRIDGLKGGHCTLDWVSIESLTASGATKLHGVFCDDRAPAPFTSVENQVRINYFYRGYTSSTYSKFTLKFKAVRLTDIEIAKFLIENKDLKNENLPKAVSSLFLLDNSYFSTEKTKAENITNMFQIRLVEDLVRNFTLPMAAGDLALRISGLLAVCINPRSYYGVELVYNLRQLVDNVNGIPNPYLYLTLCNAGEKMTDSDIETLTAIVETHKQELFWLDYQAMSVLALVCIKDRDLGYNVKKTLDTATAEIKSYQNEDGGFGSLQTTSLVMQALSAAKADESGWDRKATAKFFLSAMNQDNLFGSIQNLYAMVPVISNKNLLYINASNCNFSKDDVNEVARNQTVLFNYSLWRGNPVEMTSTVTLQAPIGMTFLQFTRLAADQDEKFKFKSMKMKNISYVYEIGGLSNDPSSGRYWTLYTGTHVLNLEPYGKALDHYIPQDGEMAVMWYKIITVKH